MLIVLALVVELPKAPTAANIARVLAVMLAVVCFIIYHKLSCIEEEDDAAEERECFMDVRTLYVPIEEDDDFYKMAEAAIAEQRLNAFRAQVEKTDFSIMFLREERDKRASEKAGGESA